MDTVICNTYVMLPSDSYKRKLTFNEYMLGKIKLDGPEGRKD